MQKFILFLFISFFLFGCSSNAILYNKIIQDIQSQYKPKSIDSLAGINLSNRSGYSTIWRVTFAQVVRAGKEEIFTTTDCPEEYPEWFLFKYKDCMGEDGEYEIGSLNRGSVILGDSRKLESYIIISSIESTDLLQIISHISLEAKGAITKMKNEQERYSKYIMKAIDRHQLNISIESYNKTGERRVYPSSSAVILEYKRDLGELILATEIKYGEGNIIDTLLRARYIGIIKDDSLK